jgi:hypothetical protein
MEQACAALENLEVAVGEERHLGEGLALQMLGSAIVERHAAHRKIESRLLERPTQPQIANEAARPPFALGHPVIGPDDQCHDPYIPVLVAAERV